MSIQIDLPDHLDLDEREVRWRLAAKLFDEGLLTSGQAADVVGITKAEFIRGVGRFEVSVFQYTAAEIEEELKRAV